MRALRRAAKVTCAAALALVTFVCSAHASEPSDLMAPFSRAATLTHFVRNGTVTPRWIGKSDEFWYQRDTTLGHEFRIYDAATRRGRSAFDHASLSAALRAMGEQAPADALPLADLEFADAGGRVRFRVGANHYDCATSTVSCTRATTTPEDVSPSPDGRVVAFVRGANLWLRDVSTGIEQALTTDGRPDDGYGIRPDGWKADFVIRERNATRLPPWGLQWSPDGTRLIIPRLDQRHVARYPFIEYAPADSFRPRVYSPRLPLVGERPASVRWYVIDVAHRAVNEIAFPYERLLDLQQDMTAVRRWMWNPDGRRVYAAAFGTEMSASYLFEVDATTGRVRTIISEDSRPHGTLNSSSYNPPNVQLVGNGAEVLWYSERDGWGHLYLFETATGRQKARLTSGPWLVRDVISVDAERRYVYFTGAGRERGNPYFRFLYRVGLDGSDLRLLTPEPMDHSIAAADNDVLNIGGGLSFLPISPSGRFVAYTSSTVDQPPRSTIRRIADGALVSVFERADVSALQATGYEPPVPFVARAATGEEWVHGVLYRPTQLDPAKKYPVLDAEYASPLTAVVPHNYMAALQASASPQPSELARHGFAVVVIDSRGTTYRSRAFSSAMSGRLDTMNLDDHVAAIRQLAEQYPWLDASRVGIYGGSYGGWSALRGMLAFPDFYDAAIATVGPGTMHSMYADYHWSAFQGPPRYADGTSIRPGPKDVPINWTRLDSVAQVEKLRGSLLMIIGALDENVPAGSSLQFYQAALDAEKDVSLIYRPQRNHFDTRDAVTRRHSINFFNRVLGEPKLDRPLAEK